MKSTISHQDGLTYYSTHQEFREMCHIIFLQHKSLNYEELTLQPSYSSPQWKEMNDNE